MCKEEASSYFHDFLKQHVLLQVDGMAQEGAKEQNLINQHNLKAAKSPMMVKALRYDWTKQKVLAVFRDKVRNYWKTKKDKVGGRGQQSPDDSDVVTAEISGNRAAGSTQQPDSFNTSMHEGTAGLGDASPSDDPWPRKATRSSKDAGGSSFSTDTMSPDYKKRGDQQPERDQDPRGICSKCCSIMAPGPL